MNIDEHPEEVTLVAYCQNQVDQETIDAIEAHLNDCGECCRRVVRIVKALMARTVN